MGRAQVLPSYQYLPAYDNLEEDLGYGVEAFPQVNGIIIVSLQAKWYDDTMTFVFGYGRGHVPSRYSLVGLEALYGQLWTLVSICSSQCKCESFHGQAERFLDSVKEKEDSIAVNLSLYRTYKLESLDEVREILKLSRDQALRIAPNLYHPVAFIDVVEDGIVAGPCARLIKVAIPGGGLMGSEITTVFLLSNYYVILKEVNDKVLEAGIDRIKGKLSQEKFVKALSLHKGTLDYEKFRDVDMVIEDGTWGTIKGSCTVVRDFADMYYHSTPMYLKALHDSPASLDLQPFRMYHGLFIGTDCGNFSLHCYRHNKEPIYVVQRMFSYLSMLLIILVAARPHYQNNKGSSMAEYSVKQNGSVQGRLNSIFAEAPPMLVPSLTSSRSVREAIQKVKMTIKITKRVKFEDSNVTVKIMRTRSHLKERKGNESVDLRPSTMSSKIIMLEEQSVESYGNCYR
ncbi:hypothetical protein FXO38_09929 [Capsicum annuum]|nr:hypothetical protein FXO38_09929 [Capsicum annuum]